MQQYINYMCTHLKCSVFNVTDTGKTFVIKLFLSDVIRFDFHICNLHEMMLGIICWFIYLIGLSRHTQGNAKFTGGRLFLSGGFFTHCVRNRITYRDDEEGWTGDIRRERLLTPDLPTANDAKGKSTQAEAHFQKLMKRACMLGWNLMYTAVQTSQAHWYFYL